ncbi:hypothetical protein SP41_111 [Salmonella phage 41]|nr:hypothetical protein SP41_111 [Salmonella phage 41]
MVFKLSELRGNESCMSEMDFRRRKSWRKFVEASPYERNLGGKT